MPLEIKDLAGLSEPMTKLIEVVSAAIGTAYRPRSIKAEADAKAYEIKVLASATAEAEATSKAIEIRAIEDRISVITRDNPELAERARNRLLAREIEGQFNVEQIAEQASLALPSTVSAEPVNADWRRKFFQEAENVCEADMQVLWGKVLAGEIAQPGTFGLRTLETLKQLSRHEAELFRQICGIAMSDGWVVIAGHDINTVLKPFGFSYDEILKLRDAGLLLHGDGIYKSFSITPPMEQPDARVTVFTNNGVLIQLAGQSLVSLRIPSLVFTQAGRELQRLIAIAPNEQYLNLLGTYFRQQNINAKRGSTIPQSDTVSLIVFEQDL